MLAACGCEGHSIVTPRWSRVPRPPALTWLRLGPLSGSGGNRAGASGRRKGGRRACGTAEIARLKGSGAGAASLGASCRDAAERDLAHGGLLDRRPGHPREPAAGCKRGRGPSVAPPSDAEGRTGPRLAEDHRHGEDPIRPHRASERRARDRPWSGQSDGQKPCERERVYFR